MVIALKDLLKLVKEIPSDYYEKTHEKLMEIREEANAEKESKGVT